MKHELKCKGRLCANCAEEYCVKSLDMWEDEVDMFEEDVIEIGRVWMFKEMGMYDDCGNAKDMRMFDYYEGCFIK